MKRIILDTVGFFTIDLEDDVDPQEFLRSRECREECAGLILNGTVDVAEIEISSISDEELLHGDEDRKPEDFLP